MKKLLLAVAIVSSSIPIGFVARSTWGKLPAGGAGTKSLIKTTFARGLDFPMSMQLLSDGSLMVGVPGKLLRFTDLDGNGEADGPPTVLTDQLPVYFTTSVRQAGDFIVVNVPGSISFLRRGATPASRLTWLGEIRFGFPAGWGHTNVALAVRLSPASRSRYEVFFNVGCQFNERASTATVPLSGLISGEVRGDSIYRVTVQDGGATPLVSGLEQIATGLRNAAGMAFDPATGDLYLADNNMSRLDDPSEPINADELNRLPAAAIGGAIEDFGHAHDYIEYRTGLRVGGGAIQPLVAFQPIPDPFTGSESEGPVEIAFAPKSFPRGLNNGIFVGFHGEGEFAANHENPLIYFDFPTRRYSQFISNDDPTVSHLDGLLATRDFLFIAEFGDASGQGAIYRIAAR
jgi:glucose/arabinose dehydrogenase